MSGDVYLNFVNGQWKQGSSGQWDENRNPARPSEMLGRTTRSTAFDIDRAVDVAWAAQKEWARRPRPARGQLLAKTAQVLKAKLETFAKTITREEGKGLNEARAEIQRAISALDFYAGEARRPLGEMLPSEVPGTLIYTTRAPLGVVGILTPWTSPVAIPASKIAAALLEGNSVVFKPASLTPASSTLLVRAFEEAGVPAGVLNLVYGAGAVIGQALVEHPKIRGLSFTGSHAVGTALNEKAARRLLRMQLELGGKNAVIVAEDADLELAAQATVQGAFGSSGQRCTATSRVLVSASVADVFREKLLARVREIKVGDGLADANAMGPMVDEASLKSALEALEAAKNEGARVLCGGERVYTSQADHGWFLAPTVLDQVKPSMKIAREEVFGPVLAMMTFQKLDDAFEVANAVDSGLASSLFTSNLSQALQYVERLEAGTLHVNSPTMGGEVHAPFGGMKAAGTGRRELGRQGAEFFSEIKTVYVESGHASSRGPFAC